MEQKRFEKLEACAQRITEGMDERGLYCEVRTVRGDDEMLPEDSGVYIVFGCNMDDVDNLAFSPFDMVRTYEKQQIGNHNIFPHHTVYKLKDTSFAAISEFCNERDAVHLLVELFPRYGMKVPEKITRNDYLAVARAYFESIDTNMNDSGQREDSRKHLEHLLKVLDSGLTDEEYEKEYGMFTVLENKKLAKAISKKAKEISERRTTYIGKGKNCVSDTRLKQSGNHYISVNMDYEILPDFERELEQYPYVLYSIEKTGIPYLYDDIGYKFWHMVTFAEQCENIVAAVMHKYERDIADISKKYMPWKKERTGVQILSLDFDQVYMHCLKNNIDFYLDENGVFAKNTIDRIAVVTENHADRDKLNYTLSQLIESKLKGTYLDKDPEYIEKKDIEANRRAVLARFNRND